VALTLHTGGIYTPRVRPQKGGPPLKGFPRLFAPPKGSLKPEPSGKKSAISQRGPQNAPYLKKTGAPPPKKGAKTQGKKPKAQQGGRNPNQPKTRWKTGFTENPTSFKKGTPPEGIEELTLTPLKTTRKHLIGNPPVMPQKPDKPFPIWTKRDTSMLTPLINRWNPCIEQDCRAKRVLLKKEKSPKTSP